MNPHINHNGLISVGGLWPRSSLDGHSFLGSSTKKIRDQRDDNKRRHQNVAINGENLMLNQIKAGWYWVTKSVLSVK